ncbi:MAG: EAL domain-containing protein [Actinomycetota bacterium]
MEAESRSGDPVLEAVGYAAEQFLTTDAWEDRVDDVLQRLGRAVEASRAYVYQNHTSGNGQLLMSQRYEWCDDGVRPTLGNPETLDFPYERGFERLEKLLSAGDPVYGLTNDFPESEQEDLKGEGILSMASVPIFAGEEWWGYFGFDDTETERDWTKQEIHALQAAAGTMGTAINRRKIEEKLRSAEKQLYEAEQKFQSIVERIPAVLYLDPPDEEKKTIYVSPQIKNILGISPENYIENPEIWYAMLHPDDRERAEAEYESFLETGQPDTSDYRYIREDGKVVWVHDVSSTIRDEDGKLTLVQGIMFDVTDQKEAEMQLREAEAKYRALLEKIPAVTYLDPIDENEPSVYVSPQVETILGCTPEEWLANPQWWSNHIHPDDADTVWETYSKHRENAEPLAHEYRMVRDDGRTVWIREEAQVLRNEDGEPWLIQGLMHDVTAQKEAEQKISYMAYHDRLTDLPNRAMFEEHLELALARAQRSEQAIAVLFMDLDNFKLLNDSLGHAAGDELLRQMADRLKEATRETDLVARQGGDEFLVLLADIEMSADDSGEGNNNAYIVAEAVASRVHEALKPAFNLGGGSEFYTSASIGISVCPLDASDAGSLLKNADAAMYRSKKAGPGSYVIHTREATDASTQLTFTNRLRKAVERQHWLLYYQPLVDLKKGEMVGLEALVRWRDPNGGIIRPGEFIPLAEEIDLIDAIGDWVLEELCRQVELWKVEGLEVDVSFNLSPRQLRHPELPDHILPFLQQRKVDPARIIMEVTESTAMTDPERTQKVLWQLHAQGLRLAIDDFGTGSSSLSRLKHLPIDILKVDQSFIRDIPEDENAGSMVTAIIDLARGLKITSLAEGIETMEQWRFLTEAGCELGQGYLFSRPVPAAEISARFQKDGHQVVEQPPQG